MKTYNLELSQNDFEKMAMEIGNFEQKLEKAKIIILQALSDYAIDRIVYYISTTVYVNNITDYVGTDELINSITKTEIFNDTIRVYTDNAYAKFVEYGTGVRGEGTHPEAEQDGWQYNYQRETTGQPAHKFMYNAFQNLRQNYMQIAIDSLRKAGIV